MAVVSWRNGRQDQWKTRFIDPPAMARSRAWLVALNAPDLGRGSSSQALAILSRRHFKAGAVAVRVGQPSIAGEQYSVQRLRQSHVYGIIGG